MTARPPCPTGSGLASISFARSEEGATALFKRHLGLRVAAVAFVASLLVLGLQAPASATSGDHFVVLADQRPGGVRGGDHGTNSDPIVTSVDIGGTPVSAFKVVSGTEIWATVAGDASGTIHVTNASATASSPTDFTNANPGGCSNHYVLHAMWWICGIHCDDHRDEPLKSSGMTTTAALGGDVHFAPYTATATHTGTPETPTRLTVLVPPGTIDGSIRVSTFNDVLGEGADLSDTRFGAATRDRLLPARPREKHHAEPGAPRRSGKRTLDRGPCLHRLRCERSGQDPTPRLGAVGDGREDNDD